MKKPDDFFEYYADLLDGTYDCVDRLVLNSRMRSMLQAVIALAPSR